jgi:hypothetical protein
VNKLKLIWLTIIQLPRSIADTWRQREKTPGLKELEAERLDRIRNPSKYRGKDL